jgi:sortase (surface protein transpeptidase)
VTRRLIAALCAVVALAGCGTLGGGNDHSPTDVPSTTTSSPPSPPADPADVDIPKLAVHSTLVPLGLAPDKSLATPDVYHPEQVGYYHQGTNGVLPGAPGPALIVAHRDGGKREGAFWRLGELTNGDQVFVDLTDHTRLTFTVYRTLHVDKGTFPTTEVFHDTDDPEARLVTCSGKFIGGSIGYAQNTIVFAKLTKSDKI